VNGWDVRPTLDRANANRRPLAQAAGSFVAGSPLPQALIQCRQRLTYELRLGKLVILSWSAPQPVADDSAVAWPSTASSPVSTAPQNGPGTRRHATFRARPHSAHIIACRATCMCAPVPRDLIPLPQVAPPSRSKMALNSRSVPFGLVPSPPIEHSSLKVAKQEILEPRMEHGSESKEVVGGPAGDQIHGYK